MMRLLALVAAFAAGPLAAEAPTTSIRPVVRGETVEPNVTSGLTRPLMRPAGVSPEAPSTVGSVSTTTTQVSALAVQTSIRPATRTAAVVKAGEAAKLARARGQVCGDPDIQGEAIGEVTGRGACGIPSAVRLRAVAGVTFSERPTIDCKTAKALKTWVRNALIPTIGSEGGGVSQIMVVGHYSCRTRNNLSGARLSEHSFGHAIDISGFKLANGERITVLNGWGTADDGAQLRRVHAAACGTFGTVLGPAANAFHRDHFHFDTARYRSGSYCR